MASPPQAVSLAGPAAICLTLRILSDAAPGPKGAAGGVGCGKTERGSRRGARRRSGATMTIASDTKASLEIVTAGEPSRRPSAALRPRRLLRRLGLGRSIFCPSSRNLGWHGVAVSLRGHGRSAGRKDLDRFGLADFVADVASAAASLDQPPVVVGHSMGGVVAQHFVQRHAGCGPGAARARQSRGA